ncbi:RNA cap guanine-N2 methyltransferase-domain-containing protein [Terfezia claveryi]|nr:RNA cap guanine-N2 methyltransferase-domain-containing protein [Terfezia claveryi]
MKRAREESDNSSDIGESIRKHLKKEPAAKVVPGKVDKSSPPSSPSVSESEESEESEESRNELRGRVSRGAGKKEGGSDDSDDSVYYDDGSEEGEEEGERGLDLDPDSVWGNRPNSDSDPSGSDPSGSGSDSSSSSSDSSSDADSDSDKPDELSASTSTTTTTTSSSYPMSLPINLNDTPRGVTLYSSTTSPYTIPPTLHSYYAQRHRLFSKFDSGIYMTPSSWYEVTPEAIAAQIGKKMLAPFQAGEAVVLDAFCGIGGNTIQFALHPGCKRVIALDTDPNAIWCARRNCQRYGVGGKVVFLEMSFFEWVEREVGVAMKSEKEVGVGTGGREEVDVVFCSPPWGGPEYRSLKVFDVEKMKPYGFRVVWEGAMKALRSPRISTTYTNLLTPITNIAKAAFFMPRTSDLNQFAGYIDKLNPAAGSGSKGKGKAKELGATVTAEAIHYTLSGKSKAVCLYVDIPITAPVVGDNEDTDDADKVDLGGVDVDVRMSDE